jgi:hypothetical protein
MRRNTGKAEQQLFEIEKPIKGYNQVIVSVKPDGVDGLSASYFIWGTKNGFESEKELAWDCGEAEYNHEAVLTELVNAT